MKERAIELEDLERLQLENSFLKEEIVKRDLAAASATKNEILSKILAKYSVDPKASYGFKDGKLIIKSLV